MARSVRSYQREIRELKNTIGEMQWVQPTYNGNPSCSGCGMQKHLGCSLGCPAASVTRDFGQQEPGFGPIPK
jgi:hypothetical protein